MHVGVPAGIYTVLRSRTQWISRTWLPVDTPLPEGQDSPGLEPYSPTPCHPQEPGKLLHQGLLFAPNQKVHPPATPGSVLPFQARTGARGEGTFPLRAVGEGAAGRPSFRPSPAPPLGGRGPGPGASACARLWALSGLRGLRAHRPSDRTDRRTHGAAQAAGTRRDSDMAGYIQQPSGRGSPGPAPSPSPGPGPGPGASERVALKKEIGLLSACTIIIGKSRSGQDQPPRHAPLRICYCGVWPECARKDAQSRSWHHPSLAFHRAPSPIPMPVDT